MMFLERLDEDIRINLLEQLRVLWTHTSTALEGNTLSLGETAFVLREGLTISGKSLKDHRDIEGHARAVDVLRTLAAKDEITAADLFDLHRLVITDQILDVYKPTGDWKRENNSTSITLHDRQTIIEYSNHWEVQELMTRWLNLLNQEIASATSGHDLLNSYVRLHLSFVSIHPFWDGNGRIARLIANLPCLKAGYPPIIIAKEDRYEYIVSLAEYQLVHGVPSRTTELVQEGAQFQAFSAFCQRNWGLSLELVEQAQAVQQNREIAAEKHLLELHRLSPGEK